MPDQADPRDAPPTSEKERQPEDESRDTVRLSPAELAAQLRSIGVSDPVLDHDEASGAETD